MATWFGCSDASTGPTPACTGGDLVACSCDDSSEGVSLCLDDAAVTACVCSDTALAADRGCGAPGTLQPCACEGRFAGQRACKADGTFGACDCQNASAPDDTSGDDAPLPSDDSAPDDTASEPPPEVERCCHSQGRCLERRIIPSTERARFGRESCGDVEQACVPDAFLKPESLQLEKCRSFAQVEGRCYPQCLPDVAAQRAELPRDVCGAYELCVPCVDPFSGETTGACELGVDPGPSEPPMVFGTCCLMGDTSLGRCLPGSAVPAAAANLPALECNAAGEVCVLNSLIAAPEQGLASCHGRLGGLGACVPRCMVEENLAPLLIADVCAAGELCVPCTIAGQETGVCVSP